MAIGGFTGDEAAGTPSPPPFKDHQISKYKKNTVEDTFSLLLLAPLHPPPSPCPFPKILDPPLVSFRDCSVKVSIFQICLQDGRTALHLAARYGHTNVVEILIQHGADINTADEVRIKLAISDDKRSFICHLGSRSQSTVVPKIVSKYDWMRIHTLPTTAINCQISLIFWVLN